VRHTDDGLDDDDDELQGEVETNGEVGGRERKKFLWERPTDRKTVDGREGRKTPTGRSVDRLTDRKDGVEQKEQLRREVQSFPL
jgi:hypothetical protein